MPNCQPSNKAQPAQPEDKEPPSPTSSTSSTQHQKEVAEEVGPSKVPSQVGPSKVPLEVGPSKAPSQVSKPATPSASLNSQKADTASETTNQLVESDAEATQIEPVPHSEGNESTNLPPKETLMEESIRLTRGRFRKTRSTTR